MQMQSCSNSNSNNGKNRGGCFRYRVNPIRVVGYLIKKSESNKHRHYYIQHCTASCRQTILSCNYLLIWLGLNSPAGKSGIWIREIIAKHHEVAPTSPPGHIDGGGIRTNTPPLLCEAIVQTWILPLDAACQQRRRQPHLQALPNRHRSFSPFFK